jgi:hypothetical protein
MEHVGALSKLLRRGVPHQVDSCADCAGNVFWRSAQPRHFLHVEVTAAFLAFMRVGRDEHAFIQRVQQSESDYRRAEGAHSDGTPPRQPFTLPPDSSLSR